MSTSSGVGAALRAVRARVAELCKELGRPEPTLVAVSKTKPEAMLMEAYDEGHRHFGENYVQELLAKAPNMPADIRWHYIGTLQTNKAKLVAKLPNLYIVESVHSAKLATALDKAIANEGRAEKLRVMVQVNTSGEDSKSGVEPAECSDLIAHVLNSCAQLDLVGLMTIGRLGDVSPECFETLSRCRSEALEAFPELTERPFLLSMGMSGDFELAIRHGSDSIRVGSSIFGARDYGAAKTTTTTTTTTTGEAEATETQPADENAAEAETKPAPEAEVAVDTKH